MHILKRRLNKLKREIYNTIVEYGCNTNLYEFRLLDLKPEVSTIDIRNNTYKAAELFKKNNDLKLAGLMFRAAKIYDKAIKKGYEIR